MNESDILAAENFISLDEQKLQSWYNSASDAQVNQLMKLLSAYERYLANTELLLFHNSSSLPN